MSDTPDPASFRAEAREWFAKNAPDPETLPPADSPAYVAASKAFAKSMFDAGFAGVDWPEEYGGRGYGPTLNRAFLEEKAQHLLPLVIFDIGLGMCGPTISDLGTEEQKQRYLRPMLEGTEIWCQLFSEPAAGSDVAGLRMTAVPTPEGGYVINGQKVWTTGAQFCDFGIILVRTNPDLPKHRGITMLIVDMRADGVTVRPMKDMTGTAHFNEVFFDDVVVAPGSVIGEVNGGWNAARTLLLHERLAVTRGGGNEGGSVGPLTFTGLVAAARRSGVIVDPTAQGELLDLYLLEESIDLFNNRIARESADGGDPGARGSVGKLLKARREAKAGALASRFTGGAQMAHSGELADLDKATLYSLALAIGGGTDEIQLSIIGERVLGLPREPQNDLKVPYNQTGQTARTSEGAR